MTVDSPRFRAWPVRFVLLAILGAIAIVLGVHFATDRPVAEAVNTQWTGNVTVGSAGLTIAAGDTVTFNPNADTTVSSSGNIIVRGTLIMKPANGNVDHILRFTGINEANFVGGGMDPIASDVGLWVMGSGRIILQGESKPAWSYTYQSSWAGDEVIAAPNTPNNYNGFTAVSSTPGKNALGYATELLNLTRNVRIEGTPGGYSHIFIRSALPSSIKNAAFRYMAPDVGNTDITGRYGLHIHMSGNGSRGTVVDGVVVRDTRGHAFVPHLSNGITFKNTIAYNVRGEAYWWDEGDDSDDIIFDRAVAARLTMVPGGEDHRMSAFFLGAGNRMTVTNSVAVGVQNEGGADRSGYIWPEDAEGTWTFRNNRAHNNDSNGIFVWQNNEMPHVIENFTAYYNSGYGIDHGAYSNSYVYKNIVLRGNGTPINSLALGEPGDGGADTQIWSNINTGGGTLAIGEHALEGQRPVRFLICDFGTVRVSDDEGPEGSLYDFINCGLEPSDFDLRGARADSVFRVQRPNGSAYRLTGNGTVTNIGKFYHGPFPSTPAPSCPNPVTTANTYRGVGDFTGDDRSDTVTYDGGSGRWTVFRSDGTGFTPSTWATFSTRTGWTSRLVGDFSGDGRADVANFHPSNGTWFVSRSTGAAFSTSIWADFSTASGWGSRLMGDFNGDGRDDIANYHVATGGWWVSRSTGSAFTTTQWADFATFCGWKTHVAGDFNGDGRDDIASFHPSNGTWWVSRSGSSNTFTTAKWADFATASGWTTQIVGDFNGDGRDDIANYFPSNGTWWVSRSTGSGFATARWDDFSTASGWTSQLVGDFNGDGRDDIANYYASNGTWWISRANSNNTFTTTKWADYSTTSGWTNHLVGDFNNDGRDDIANRHSSGNWIISRSTGSTFQTTTWYP